LDTQEVVTNKAVAAAARRRRFRLRLTRTGFIRVSLNMSWADKLRANEAPDRVRVFIILIGPAPVFNVSLQYSADTWSDSEP